MVKAAENFIYGKDSYKEGDEIPDSLVPELEKHQCHVLDNFVNVNGTYYKIDDPRISGWVEQRKHLEKRLINHFKNKEEIPKIKQLTKEEFLALKREEQEKLLTELKIKFSNKDKEKDLVKKYLKI